MKEEMRARTGAKPGEVVEMCLLFMCRAGWLRPDERPQVTGSARQDRREP